MKEIYFDRISNISVQGAVTSIDLARAQPIPGKTEVEFKPKIKITLTTQNLIHFIKTLNQTAEALAKNQKNQGSEPEPSENKKNRKEKTT